MSIKHRPFSFIALMSATALVAQPALSQERLSDASLQSGESDVVFERQEADEARLNKAASQLKAALDSEEEWLRQVYEQRDYEAVWTGMFNRPSAAFRRLVSEVRRAEARGVSLERDTANQLENLKSASREGREIDAARMLVEIVHDLRYGLVPADNDLAEEQRLAFSPDAKKDILTTAYERRNPGSVIDDAFEDNFVVDNLLAALDRYEGYREQGGWDAIAFDDRTIEVGAVDEDIPRVRERLEAEGFDTGRAPENPRLYDENLEEALIEFQATRAMAQDGIIGPNTIDALNETVDDLIDKLSINIERARWLPDDLGDKAVFVNIADYQMRMLEDNHIIDTMKVIVGKRNQQTPVFFDEMEQVVINPYWNVPSSITIEEIAPKMLENPSYIENNNMEVLAGSEIISPSSVDWSAAANGDLSFRVRQRPGNSNALGRIKFLFPNEYAVYLHDTPADQLFAADRRTFSHGCIRVESPMRFAEFVTRNTNEWDRFRVERAIEDRERVAFDLNETIPVYITYFTAWAGPDGQAGFAQDIYERDGRIAQPLDARKTGNI